MERLSIPPPAIAGYFGRLTPQQRTEFISLVGSVCTAAGIGPPEHAPSYQAWLDDLAPTSPVAEALADCIRRADLDQLRALAAELALTP